MNLLFNIEAWERSQNFTSGLAPRAPHHCALRSGHPSTPIGGWHGRGRAAPFLDALSSVCSRSTPIVVWAQPERRSAAHGGVWGEEEGGKVARPQIARMFVRHPK